MCASDVGNGSVGCLKCLVIQLCGQLTEVKQDLDVCHGSSDFFCGGQWRSLTPL